MALAPFAGRFSRDRPKASVPDGTRVYAIGDSHGCVDQLEVLHETILADCERLVKNFHDPEPGAMVRIALCPSDPFTASEGLMTGAAELADRRRPLPGRSASRMRSSTAVFALSCTSRRLFCLRRLTEASTRSRIIDSTSRPT